MSRLFSPDYRPPASYNPMQSSRSKTGSGVDEEKPLPPRFNPRTKLYDREGNLTGRQIGAGSKEMSRRDQHGRPTGKLELGSLDAERRARGEPNPFEARLSRTDRIAQARADGTFDAKRNAFNAASTGSVMNERGEIVPRAPGTGGQGGGTTAGQPPKGGGTPVSDLAAPFFNLPGGIGSFARTAAQIGDRVMQPGGVQQPPAPAQATGPRGPTAEERELNLQGIRDQRMGVAQRGTDGSVLFNSGGFIEPNRPGQKPGATLQSPYGSGSVEYLAPGTPRAPGRLSDDRNVAPSSNFFQDHADRTGQPNRFATPRGQGGNAGVPATGLARPGSQGQQPTQTQTYASSGGTALPQAATPAPAGGGGLAATSEPINLSGGGGGGGSGAISLGGGGGGLGGATKKKAVV